MSIQWKGSILSGLVIGLLISGCSQSAEQNRPFSHNASPLPENIAQMEYNAVPHDGEKSYGRYEESSRGRVDLGQLTQLVSRMSEVNQAHVVMNNTDVVIGIDVTNPGKAGLIEKQVYSQLKWQYPEYNFHVTADRMLYEKIQTASANKTKGYQAQSLNNEIDAIVRDIARTVIRP